MSLYSDSNTTGSLPYYIVEKGYNNKEVNEFLQGLLVGTHLYVGEYERGEGLKIDMIFSIDFAHNRKSHHLKENKMFFRKRI
jgi:hypothetical protein